MSEPFATHFDPDIGRCDDCGSEEGTRVPVERAVTIGGMPTHVHAWLCPACRSATDPYEYTIEYRRVMTVSSSAPMSRAELREHAAEALIDSGALWRVLIEGTWFTLEPVRG